jgi:hypothetical protein
MENNFEIVNFVLLSSSTPGDYIVNVKTCLDSGDFKLIARTCVIMVSTVIINKESFGLFIKPSDNKHAEYQ